MVNGIHLRCVAFAHIRSVCWWCHFVARLKYSPSPALQMQRDNESGSESVRTPQLMKQWLICIGQSSTVAAKVMNWSWEILFSISAITVLILERSVLHRIAFRSTLITTNSVRFCKARQTRWLRPCEIRYMNRNTFGVDRKPKDRIDRKQQQHFAPE